VSDERIFEIIRQQPDLPAATNQLIEEANMNGGPDNVTAVLARWVE
jgi:serine/threonine protein phosphatase PrpC